MWIGPTTAARVSRPCFTLLLRYVGIKSSDLQGAPRLWHGSAAWVRAKDRSVITPARLRRSPHLGSRYFASLPFCLGAACGLVGVQKEAIHKSREEGLRYSHVRNLEIASCPRALHCTERPIYIFWPRPFVIDILRIGSPKVDNQGHCPRSHCRLHIDHPGASQLQPAVLQATHSRADRLRVKQARFVQCYVLPFASSFLLFRACYIQRIFARGRGGGPKDISSRLTRYRVLHHLCDHLAMLVEINNADYFRPPAEWRVDQDQSRDA